MGAIEQLLEQITSLTPLAIGIAALAGLVVGVAPSSYPLISVGAGFVAAQDAPEGGAAKAAGLWLSAAFVLGIVTVDAALGALFGFAGFGVMRVLAQILAPTYAILAVALAIMGLALLRVVHIRIPVLNPNPKPVRSVAGSYLLGLPFGLSTCPACTPLMLPLVMVAASTGDPVTGATLMLVFGLARGVPVMLAGFATGWLKAMRNHRALVVWVERVAGGLALVVALYFGYMAGSYAGWLSPL
jgi:cytochrome c-type biogenesis protein